MSAPTISSAAWTALVLVISLGAATAIGIGTAEWLHSPRVLQRSESIALQAAALVAFAVGSLQLIAYSFQSYKGKTPGEKAARWITFSAYFLGCALSGFYIAASTAQT